MEDEKRALIGFVSDIDPYLRRLESGPLSPSLLRQVHTGSTRTGPPFGESSSSSAPLAPIAESSPIKAVPGFMDSPIKRVLDPMESPVKMDLSRAKGEMSLLHEVVDDTAGVSPTKATSSPRAPFTPVRSSPFRLMQMTPSPTKNSPAVVPAVVRDKENLTLNFTPHRLFT